MFAFFKKSEKKGVCFLFLSLCRYAIALERKQKETEKRKNEKTLDLKGDGCIPYVFKVYVDERSQLFE